MKTRVSGFTLIELLVAITLAAGVTVATTLLLRSALDYEKRQAAHWADRAGLRDSQQLLSHYWGQRQTGRFTFSAARLLLYVSEGGRRYFVGFSCTLRDDGRHDFAFSHWPATAVESERIQEGGEWPVAAAQVLLADLPACGFSFLQPPAAASDAPARWVSEWPQPATADPAAITRDTPTAVRLDLIGPGGALPPLIFQALAG